MPAVITRAITNNKIKIFKSNNVHSIDGSKDSIPMSMTKTTHLPSLLSIGVNATTFEIPAKFVTKSYLSIPIPLGNPPRGIPIGPVPLHLERFFPGRHFAVIPVSYHIKSILFQFSLFFFCLRPRFPFWSAVSPHKTHAHHQTPSEPAVLFCHVVSGVPPQNTCPPSDAILDDL